MVQNPFDGTADNVQGLSDSATAAAQDALVIEAAGQTHLDLPGGDFIRDAQMIRDGQDLVLQAPDGGVIVIEGYFSAMPAPTLLSPDGLALSPALVQSFVKQAGALQYADLGVMNDASSVGTAQEVSGNATVTRTDGSTHKLTNGTPVYEGDIVETDAEGAVNIVFVDQSSFAISGNARLAIDEYVFDPATEKGATNVSMLRGLFLFTSGLIGRNDPDDVNIETPQGSIGIRGTVIAGNVDTGEITVMEGAIVLRGHDGSGTTLATPFETAKFSATGGVEHMGTMDANDFDSAFGGLKGVAGDFFAALDAGNDNSSENNASSDSDESGDATATDEQTEGQTDSQSSLDSDSGFDEAAGTDDSDGDSTKSTSSTDSDTKSSSDDGGTSSSTDSTTSDDSSNDDSTLTTREEDRDDGSTTDPGTDPDPSVTLTATATPSIAVNFYIASDDNTVYGGNSGDYFNVEGSYNDIYTGDGYNHVVLDEGINEVFLGNGDNTVDIYSSDNGVWATNTTGSNSFTIYSGFDNWLYGSDGGNSFIVQAGSTGNQIHGGSGNDVFTIHGENNTIDSTGGNNTLDIYNADNTVYAGDGHDEITIHNGWNEVYGNAAGGTISVTINAGVAGGVYEGGSANDELILKTGNFSGTFDGGAGYDVLNFMGGGGNSALDFRSLTDDATNGFITGIEEINMGGESQNITLTFDNIFDLLGSAEGGALTLDTAFETNILRFDIAQGTAANVTAANLADQHNDWTYVGTVTESGTTSDTVHHYTTANGNVFIDDTFFASDNVQVI